MSAETPLIDIRPDHWEIVQRILQEHVPNLEVWAFGSRAKWSAKEFSDLDLAIITDEPLPLDTSAALSEAFSDSDLPWKVDVVDWASVGDGFKQVIERDKVVLKFQDGVSCDVRSTNCERQSHVENGVKTLHLGNCLEALIDYRGKTPRKTSFGIPLVTAKVVRSGFIESPNEFISEGDYRSWMSRGYPEVGDVVLTTEAPLGEVGQVKYLPIALAQRVVALRGRSGVLDNKYLLYLMQSREMREKLVARSSGTTVVGIRQSELRKIDVTLPPISRQRIVAHILGALDDKIELNRKQNETLEAMARAMFKAWFVDFEPVRAKMEGRWKRGQSLPGMPAHLYDLFPDRMVESELGEIPEGWEMRTLADYSTLNPESWSKTTRPSVIRYVDLFGTKWGRIESVTDYASSEAPSRAQRVLRPLDTLVGTVRPGNGSYTLIGEEGLTGSTGFAVLRPLNRINAEFVYLAATAAENIERLSNLADGGAYPAVRPEVVLATPVPVIDPPLINVFSRQISPMLEEVSENESESRVLAQLRDTLLQKLVSGALLVSGTKE
jgi:UPI00006A2470 related cluster